MSGPGRAMLLRAATEDQFARWVKGTARRYGWNGIHIRWSQGTLEAVHTARLDGWSEAYGMPDWLYWHEELEQSFWAELKSWKGRLSRGQKRQLPSMRKGGIVVFEWWPQDEEAIEAIFRNGLG